MESLETSLCDHDHLEKVFSTSSSPTRFSVIKCSYLRGINSTIKTPSTIRLQFTTPSRPLFSSVPQSNQQAIRIIPPTNHQKLYNSLIKSLSSSSLEMAGVKDYRAMGHKY